MEQTSLNELSDAELIKETKTRKSYLIIGAVLIGFMVGISAYSTYRSGFGIFTLFPLFFLSIGTNNAKKYNEAKAEMERRGIKLS